MGKQPRRPAAVGSEEEHIRALTRELHEHTQAARQATRDLRAAEANADLARARLSQAAADALTGALTAISTRMEEAQAAAEKDIDLWAAQFRDAIAKQADMPSGDALVKQVTVGLGALIRPLVDEAIGEVIDHRLTQLLALPVPDDADKRGRRRSVLFLT